MTATQLSMAVSGGEGGGPTTQTGPIRVLCIDDVDDVTAALRLLIDDQPDMQCVGCMSSASGLLEKVRLQHPQAAPNVVVLDASMPGRDPFTAMCELALVFPHCRTIIYSAQTGQAFSDKALSNGAFGCVSKAEPPQAILDAVRRVAEGAVFFPQLNML